MLKTQGVRELFEAIGAWDGVDVRALNVDAALEVAATAAQARHALDAVLARSIGRVNELCELSPGSQGPARRRGHANAAALVSGVTGLGPGDSHRFIELGRSLLEADAAVADAAVANAAAGSGAPGESTPEGYAPGGLAPQDFAPDSPQLAAPQAGDASALDPMRVGPDLPGGVPPVPVASEPAAAPQPASPPSVPGAYLAAAIDAGRIEAKTAEIIRLTLADFTIDTIEIERDFVDYALSHTPRQLKKYCFTTLGKLDPEGLMERERRQIRSRFLSVTDGADGMITLFGKFDVMTGAAIKTVLDEATARGIRAQRGLPPEEQFKPGQIMADALSDIAKHAMTCTKVPTRAKSTVILRIPKDGLIHDLREAGKVDDRGRPVDASAMGTCDGVLQPLSPTMLRMMAVDVEILPAIMGGDPIPLELGYAQRGFSPGQTLAIRDRDGGCIRCDKEPAYCETHHVIFWSNDGPTDAHNGASLCTGCHHRLHEQFWRLEKGQSGYMEVIETPSNGGAPPGRPHPPGAWQCADDPPPDWVPDEHLPSPVRPAQLPEAQRKPAPGPAPWSGESGPPGRPSEPATAPTVARTVASTHGRPPEPDSGGLLFD